ncbi:unnamed protein product [Microthlaspi erraticum]|uniref:Arabidopsis retrotransposon Orf1 C-terminal domain-containing protein n=1 Tax=Microthlaspi erraticum TaxID=1685480 RepID=A0A6D2KN55_9BRAS|nr:unnamed protein product [Microthlaspi erraticum]
MTNSEGSRASQGEWLRVNQAMQGKEGLRCKPIWRGWKRMEDLMQRDMSTLRRQSESERLREERRTKKRNDPLVVRMTRGNQDEPWRRPTEEEDELPMYQEHYNALFSMDFMETKYPHVDTMKALGIFEDVELVSRTCTWPSFSLTTWNPTRSSLASS